MKILTKIKLFFIVGLMLFATTPVWAAEVVLESEKTALMTGEEILVTVSLNTENEPLNAVEGKVVFPDGLLEVKEIRSGNSAVNFWLEKPHQDKGGEIIFSGIIPGGFARPKEFLFSLVLKSKKAGQGAIQVTGLKILKNDGNGTLAMAKTTSFQFSITAGVVATRAIKPIDDREPPENFKLSIAKDSSVFEGQSFLIFTTQDKGSGIKNYKVREGFFSWYKIAESPYLLKHQKLNKQIFVKAVDNNGNERVAVLYPQATAWSTNLVVITVIILGVVLLVFFLIRKKWPRFLQK